MKSCTIFAFFIVLAFAGALQAGNPSTQTIHHIDPTGGSPPKVRGLIFRPSVWSDFEMSRLLVRSVESGENVFREPTFSPKENNSPRFTHVCESVTVDFRSPPVDFAEQTAAEEVSIREEVPVRNEANVRVCVWELHTLKYDHPSAWKALAMEADDVQRARSGGYPIPYPRLSVLDVFQCGIRLDHGVLKGSSRPLPERWRADAIKSIEASDEARRCVHQVRDEGEVLFLNADFGSADTSGWCADSLTQALGCNVRVTVYPPEGTFH